MDAKLVVVAGEAPAQQYELSLPTVIGRSRSVGVVVPNPLVSRQHCELFESEGLLMVRDLGSLNGTFVGDMRIAQEAAIEPGKLLTIGSVTFRAVYGAVLADSGAAEPELGLAADTSSDFETQEPPAKPIRRPAAKESTASKAPAKPAGKPEAKKPPADKPPAGKPSAGKAADSKSAAKKPPAGSPPAKKSPAEPPKKQAKPSASPPVDDSTGSSSNKDDDLDDFLKDLGLQ